MGMNLRLFHNDRVRLTADHKEDLFIDITQDHYEGLSIDIYPWFCIGEVRRRDNILRLFIFKNKTYREGYDFGWWKEAEIIYSFNSIREPEKNPTNRARGP
jgi:hypothetical protein